MDIQKSLDAGMDAHVAKPIDVNTLLDAMAGIDKNYDEWLDPDDDFLEPDE